MATRASKHANLVRLPVSDAKPKPKKKRPQRHANVVVGTLTGFDARGYPLVRVAGEARQRPRPAQSTVALAAKHVGRRVTLVFEGGRRTEPIVTGVVYTPEEMRQPAPSTSSREARIDGERVVFEAQREILLQCGDASILLTREGRVIIKGRYLLQRSSGLNKIKGAAVQIN